MSIRSSIPCTKDSAASLIVRRQVKEFIACVRQKRNRAVCFSAYISLLSTIGDHQYMAALFDTIVKKSSIPSSELSTILAEQLSRQILERKFDTCESILRLPLQSLRIPLPSYELTQFIRGNSDTDQVCRCLSILIERNLRHDKDYVSWMLITLFTNYVKGREQIIEHVLKLAKHVSLTQTCFGRSEERRVGKEC